jgi:hypothetical protein
MFMNAHGCGFHVEPCWGWVHALQAWVFPALNTKSPQRLYAFAAIYALPAAFQLDSSSAWYYVTYGLCAIHFQVRCQAVNVIAAETSAVLQI